MNTVVDVVVDVVGGGGTCIRIMIAVSRHKIHDVWHMWEFLTSAWSLLLV